MTAAKDKSASGTAVADTSVAEGATSRILIPVGATADRLEELRRILVVVERRFPDPAASSGRPKQKHRIDLRFEDQIVVRPSTSAERS